ncbi:multidrug resistance protein cdr1 [Moniliophthora roreri]|nr:multidrug resistance protein cdr1 [Moniliophthora roreri]
MNLAAQNLTFEGRKAKVLGFVRGRDDGYWSTFDFHPASCSSSVQLKNLPQRLCDDYIYTNLSQEMTSSQTTSPRDADFGRLKWVVAWIRPWKPFTSELVPNGNRECIPHLGEAYHERFSVEKCRRSRYGTLIDKAFYCMAFQPVRGNGRLFASGYTFWALAAHLDNSAGNKVLRYTKKVGRASSSKSQMCSRDAVHKSWLNLFSGSLSIVNRSCQS